jgi:redox-sensitive bicupin YhaK (pirin superfamily)
MTLRAAAHVITPVSTSDGAGVRMQRSIGTQLLDHFDPFLLLDDFKSEDSADYIAGFPDHPHRGFETVTYMIAGRMRHEDHTGAGGSLGPGGVQWMTAGRGIIHSEMPEQEEGLMHGFQLWVNLPASDKMVAPRYQNIEPEDVPDTDLSGGGTAKVIAGTCQGVTGPIHGIATDPLYLDVKLPDGATLRQPVTAGHNAFVYVFEGAAAVRGDGGKVTEISGRKLAVLGDGDEVEVSALDGAARFLLVAGRPLNEPIARYGPFVMNTRAEIEQAFMDYQAGRF